MYSEPGLWHRFRVSKIDCTANLLPSDCTAVAGYWELTTGRDMFRVPACMLSKMSAMTVLSPVSALKRLPTGYAVSWQRESVSPQAQGFTEPLNDPFHSI